MDDGKRVQVKVGLDYAVALIRRSSGSVIIHGASEPTLILFPEAQGLSIADFKTLHDAALAQCAELKDRFVIMDVHGDGASLSDPDANLLTAVGNFRNSGIGTNNRGGVFRQLWFQRVEHFGDHVTNRNVFEQSERRADTLGVAHGLDQFPLRLVSVLERAFGKPEYDLFPKIPGDVDLAGGELVVFVP